MQGARDLLASERGIFCCSALVSITILAAMRVITAEQWLDFARYMVGVLVASKTVTTAVEKFREPTIPRAEVIANGNS